MDLLFTVNLRAIANITLHYPSILQGQFHSVSGFKLGHSPSYTVHT